MYIISKKCTLLVFNLTILVLRYFQYKYQKGSGHPALILLKNFSIISTNKKLIFFTCPELTWRPAVPEPGSRFTSFFSNMNISSKDTLILLKNFSIISTNKKFSFLPVQS